MSTINTPKKQAVRYRVLAEHLRRGILEGRLNAGDRLPTVNELIRQHRVSRSTVVSALQVLEDDNLISLEVGRGTFVRPRLQEGEIAIVLSDQLLATDASLFYRLTASTLMSRTAELGAGYRGRMHLARLTGQFDQPPENLDLLQPEVFSQLRGVFSFHDLNEIGLQLVQRGVPVVNLASTSTTPGLCYVRFDMRLAYQLAFEHMASRGQRAVGLIGAGSSGFNFRELRLPMISKVAQQAGVSLLPVLSTQSILTEQLGWEMFHQFREQHPNCTALLVSDEILCRGVLRAIARQGLTMPQELRLIVFATAGAPLPYEFPLTRVDMAPADMTQAAMTCLRMQADRNPSIPSEMLVPGILNSGATT